MVTHLFTELFRIIQNKEYFISVIIIDPLMSSKEITCFLVRKNNTCSG